MKNRINVKFTIDNTDNLDIELCQDKTKKALFTVRYGLQIKTDLTYTEAAKELGQCIFHALSCESVLNNNDA